jgi:hypothetical protein
MIAQGAMAFNSRRSLTACPDSVPQILVTLITFHLIEVSNQVVIVSLYEHTDAVNAFQELEDLTDGRQVRGLMNVVRQGLVRLHPLDTFTIFVMMHNAKVCTVGESYTSHNMFP